MAKAIALAFFNKSWLHVCHVSQQSQLQLIKEAKRCGLKVTCEATPHHLFLNKNDQKRLGSFAKMRPPLPTKKDQKALWQALNQGLIDYLVTDHAPHTIKEKKSANPPNGVPGLETMLPLLLTAVCQKRLTLEKLKQLICFNPGRLLGIKLKNSWIEVDLDKKWTIKNKDLETKCSWSPFAGLQVKGKVVKVYISGKRVFENGKILASPGQGRSLICH